MKRNDYGKQRNGIWVRASYTVEAACLIPVILFLLVLIGTAALYLHDRSVAAFNAQAVTTYGAMLAIGHIGDSDLLLAQYASEEGTDGMLSAENIQAEGSIGTFRISAAVEGEIQNVFSDLFSAWGWPVYEAFSQTDDDWMTDACSLIRSARILYGLSGEE